MAIHGVFEGTFAGPSEKSFVLLWEGCEWRSNGVVLVTEQSGTWSAGPFIEGVPFGQFDHCEVARSDAWGDRLICDGTLLTRFAGMRRMRGSTPYASTLTSLHFVPDGDSVELAAKLEMLLLSKDPEECDSPGARGSVVRSELREFAIKDVDGDGADDVKMHVEYLFAPAPSKTACWGKEDLKAATVVLFRREIGFEARRTDAALLKRLKLR